MILTGTPTLLRREHVTLYPLRTWRQYVPEPARKCSPVLLDFEGAQDFAMK